jgi:hypothetical protein
MIISVLLSLFTGILLFQLFTWWKAHIFMTKDVIYFSSGSYSFVFMIIFIVLLLLSGITFFINQNVVYTLVIVILLVLVSFVYLTRYSVITNEGWESYVSYTRVEKVRWAEIDNIQTDYRINTTRGTFSPKFTVTTVGGKQTIDLGKWENLITSKPKIWDFTASGWVSGDQKSALRLRQVKMMEFVYLQASVKLHCVQHGFEQPKKQLDVWQIFAKYFVEPEKCRFS